MLPAHDAHTGAPEHRGKLPLILVVLAVVLGFYLFTEHRAHLFGILPFLLFLACPLMHLFMHGGHGGHGHHAGARPEDQDREARP
jgi:Protein of unknown function (DUF2933)